MLQVRTQLFAIETLKRVVWKSTNRSLRNMTKIFLIISNPDAIGNIALLTGSEVQNMQTISESCIDVQ